MTDADDDLVFERHGGVLVLRLNRPDARNALTFEMITQIGETILSAEADPAVRVVVLIGTGDKAFCAGMDLRSFAAGATFESVPAAERAAYLRLMRGEVEVPLVGAANATALAGGLELLLGCDLIVSSDQAQFGLPEVKRGLFPGGGGTFIGQRIPMGIALELAMTGVPISAARAYEIGLVNAVVPADDVLATAVRLAEKIAANAPLGVAACKDLVRLAVADPERAREKLAEWQPRVFQSQDAIEGSTAFVERRDPVWQGR
ncbi:enoyl-CoA hydratase-related protein [Aquihabitans sp. McL0605]|uniref:enoyl-CoA hydratase-related protein n=1 Tax=Aquihabitans sp. McL0605 TaxID=3415671 RepID=UPI003CF2D70B